MQVIPLILSKTLSILTKNKKYNQLLEYPSYVEIETVNACNARCPMCTINDWERNYPTMKDDVFYKIADDFSKKLKFRGTFFGRNFLKSGIFNIF